MTGPVADQDVDVREIADLLAWARRLSEVRHHADPADRAESLAAKTTLFARLAHHHDANDHTDEPTTKDTR
jgi:hypothetical protein